MGFFNKKGKNKAAVLQEGQLGLTTDDLTPKIKIPSMRSKLSKSFEAFTEYTKNLINKTPQRDTTNALRDPKGKGKGKESPYILLEELTKVELNDETNNLDKYQPLIMTKAKNNFNMFSGKSPQIQAPKFIPAVASAETPIMSLSEEDYRQSLLSKILSGPENFSPTFSKKYDLKELLGDGAFGFVFAAVEKESEKEVAVKFILKSKIVSDGWVQEDGENLPLEVHNLKILKHPNVITYIEHIMEEDFVMLVTELWGTAWDASNLKLSPMKNPGLKFKFRKKEYEANGKSGISRTSCDLFECIDAHSSIPLNIAKYMFVQVLLACLYLQSKNMVHRDIKDENIVVDASYHLKLIDFGSASQIPVDKKDFFRRYNGTPHFAAPEIVRGHPYQGPQADVWALGVLLYTILFGENPFQGDSDIRSYNGIIVPPKPISNELHRLLESMLCIDIKRRITLEKLSVHPWCRAELESLKRRYGNIE